MKTNPTVKRRLPDWLKTSLPKTQKFLRLRSLVREHGLHTVCESASCPNIGECWDNGTLTLMILGDTCSRACRFCDVPVGRLQPLRTEEPREVADMLAKLSLRYVVITSVDRDDLADGGAGQWAETIRQVRSRTALSGRPRKHTCRSSSEISRLSCGHSFSLSVHRRC